MDVSRSPYAHFGEDPPNPFAEPLARHLPSLVVPSFAALFGFASGLASSGKLAALQFTAENAHRRPTTKQGWYFYHKTRNYRVMLAGLKGGARKGMSLALWTGTFVAIKEVVAAGLQKVDAQKELGKRLQWAGGAVGGLSIAAGAGLLYRLKPRLSPRRLLFGSAVGAAAGGFEDLRSLAREHRTAEEAKATVSS